MRSHKPGGGYLYCYVIHTTDGQILERVCRYKSLEDALRALRRRVRELEGSGFNCTVTDRDALGSEVYLCEGMMRFDPEPLPREVSIVLRVDVKPARKPENAGEELASMLESIRASGWGFPERG